VALSEVAMSDDPAILDFDECAKLIRLSEPIASTKFLEVVELVRRRLVLMGDAQLEGNLREACDCFRRDPRDGGHRRLVANVGHGRSPRGGRILAGQVSPNFRRSDRFTSGRRAAFASVVHDDRVNVGLQRVMHGAGASAATSSRMATARAPPSTDCASVQAVLNVALAVSMKAAIAGVSARRSFQTTCV
jgi:hypothetical protein